ncbi:MAG: hypothetical protein HYY81_02195 [Deltaproteobacteria bacterium]|nr:hypothetical protein [Deltaproteobacteria bacterium]
MDVDWTLINRAKNLAEDQLDQPILKLPIIPDFRQPLVEFLRPGMKVLDVGANNRSLKVFLDQRLGFQVAYKSMDIDRSYAHDFYSLEEVQEKFDAVACFEVVEHMTPGMAHFVCATLRGGWQQQGLIVSGAIAYVILPGRRDGGTGDIVGY